MKPHISKCLLYELFNNVKLFDRNDIIIRLFLLQHQQHGLNVITCKNLISKNLQIVKKYFFLVTDLDFSYYFCDLLNHKILTIMRRFMVEKNSIAHKQAISLLVIDHVLVCYNFQNNIKTWGWKMVVFFSFIYSNWLLFGFLDRIGSFFLLLELKSCVCSQRFPCFLGVFLVRKENEDCLHICCQRCSLHQTLHNVDKCNAFTFWGLEQ